MDQLVLCRLWGLSGLWGLFLMVLLVLCRLLGLSDLLHLWRLLVLLHLWHLLGLQFVLNQTMRFHPKHTTNHLIQRCSSRLGCCQ